MLRDNSALFGLVMLMTHDLWSLLEQDRLLNMDYHCGGFYEEVCIDSLVVESLWLVGRHEYETYQYTTKSNRLEMEVGSFPALHPFFLGRGKFTVYLLLWWRWFDCWCVHHQNNIWFSSQQIYTDGFRYIRNLISRAEVNKVTLLFRKSDFPFTQNIPPNIPQNQPGSLLKFPRETKNGHQKRMGELNSPSLHPRGGRIRGFKKVWTTGHRSNGPAAQRDVWGRLWRWRLRWPAVISRDLLTNGNHIFLGGGSKLDVRTSIWVIVRDLSRKMVLVDWDRWQIFCTRWCAFFQREREFTNVSPFWSLYYQPKQCTTKREIPQSDHIFAACLILPKWVI